VKRLAIGSAVLHDLEYVGIDCRVLLNSLRYVPKVLVEQVCQFLARGILQCCLDHFVLVERSSTCPQTVHNFVGRIPESRTRILQCSAAGDGSFPLLPEAGAPGIELVQELVSHGDSRQFSSTRGDGGVVDLS